MSGEIYQLIAIDEKNNEYIIDLDNNNKNSKCFLFFIDSITTSKKNEEEFISELIKEGKLSNRNVKLVIKYNYSIVKYLPVIYNEQELNSIAVCAHEEKNRKSYAEFLINKITLSRSNYDFFDYIVNLNDGIFSEINNGNYLNSHILEELGKFYSIFNYSYSNEDLAYKEEYRRKLKNYISDYKTIRTLYIFYKHYLNTKVNNLSENDKYKIPSCLKYVFPEENTNTNGDIPEELLNAYKNYGMDGVYALVDIDEIKEKGYKFR